MTNLKKLVAVAAIIGIIAAAGAAYAAVVKSPADITAGLTGKSVEELYKERAAGKTYGTIAKDAGKLDQFKTQMLEQRKAVLDQRVKDGTLTQKQADDAYAAMKNNQTTCDETGSAAIGRRSGMGSGQAGCLAGETPGTGMNGGIGNSRAGGMGFGRGLNR